MRIEVESAERSHVTSAWVLVGALDWARLLLREDARSGNIDHLAEPWAIPLQEARLSTFLAAEKGVSEDTGVQATEAFLSGQITDLQVRHSIYTNTTLKFTARTSADINTLTNSMGNTDPDFVGGAQSFCAISSVIGAADRRRVRN